MVATCYGFNIGTRADNKKLTILDCDSLSPGLGLVDSVDFPVGVYRVCDDRRIEIRLDYPEPAVN